MNKNEAMELIKAIDKALSALNGAIYDAQEAVKGAEAEGDEISQCASEEIKWHLAKMDDKAEDIEGEIFELMTFLMPCE